MRARLVALLFAPVGVLGAETLPQELAVLRLGDVSLDVSTGSAQAEAWFRYGLGHLLSFGYDYATPAFRRSREHDPAFALAYAFEAVSYFWPLWGTDDLQSANAILDNITNDSSGSRHEMMYVEAIREHFNHFAQSDGSKEHRLTGAIEAFERIAAAYPHDATALALAGLWRLELASTQVEKADSDSTWLLAEKNLLAALAVDTRHPGAVHYMIHLYDVLNTTIAERGLPAAELYPDLAPDASHGQHMPVHIFLRLANYSAAFHADTIALAAADRVCNLYGLADDEACDMWNVYHSLESLQYAGYQCGRWREAHRHWLRMNASFANATAKQHLSLDWLALWWARMEAREIVERGLLTMLAGGQFPDIDCATPQVLEPGFWTSHTESGALLAHGLCYVFRKRPGDEGAARQALDALRGRLVEIPSEFGGDDEGNPSPYYNYQVNLMHVDMLDAAAHFVRAQDAREPDARQSLLEQAWSLAEAAVAIEEGLVAQPDSPTLLFLSANELVGLLRLQSGQKADAVRAFEAFEAAAELQAVQLSTELGRARAAELQGCPGDARAWYERASELLDPQSDKDELPFWSAMHRGLQLEGTCAGQTTAVSSRAAAASTGPALAALGLLARV